MSAKLAHQIQGYLCVCVSLVNLTKTRSAVQGHISDDLCTKSRPDQEKALRLFLNASSLIIISLQADSREVVMCKPCFVNVSPQGDNITPVIMSLVEFFDFFVTDKL